MPSKRKWSLLGELKQPNLLRAGLFFTPLGSGLTGVGANNAGIVLCWKMKLPSNPNSTPFFPWDYLLFWHLIVNCLSATLPGGSGCFAGDHQGGFSS
jgi:hypothetical protein